MRKLIIILYFILISLMIKAQEPLDIIWTRIIGGHENDSGKSIQQTIDGGFIIGGHTYSYGAGSNDLWLIKTDNQGFEEWNRTFGGLDGEKANSVIQTSDNGYAIAGNTSSYGAGNLDAWVIKTDSLGIEEWSYTFGGTLSDQAFSIQQTTDEGYIITGTTESYGNAKINLWLLKLDNYGNLEWDQVFGDVGINAGYSVIQDDNNNIIVAGFKSTPDFDYWLIKTDRTGNLIWDRVFNINGEQQPREVRQTSDNGFIIAGRTRHFGTQELDFFVVKTDSLGYEEWNQYYNHLDTDLGRSVLQTLDGGFLLSGKTFSANISLADIWLVKTDINGNELWNFTIGEENEDESALAMQHTSDDSYILVGTKWLVDPGTTDILLMKLGTDVLAENIQEIDFKNYQIHNFPNPFNPKTLITYNLPKTGYVEISIYNFRGQKIKDLINKKQEIGLHSVTWNGSDIYGKKVGSGIYYYQLRFNNKFVKSHKCLLLK